MPNKRSRRARPASARPTTETKKSRRKKKGSGAALASGAVTLGAVLGAAPQADAATFTVTNLGNSGAGSLRQAILSANATPGTDAVAFQSGLSGTITLTTGQITISDAVSIYGPGPAVVTVSGNDASRIFNIDVPAVSANVHIEGLTLTDGSAPDYGGAILSANENLELVDVVVTGNVSGSKGGGVSVWDGTLVVENSVFSSNRSDRGGAIATGYYYYNSTTYAVVATGADVRITGSTFTGNTGTSVGGALYANYYSTLYIADGIITDNTAANGGAIGSEGAVTIERSTLSGNTAFRGGALYAERSAGLTINDSTLSGNFAALGGAVYLYDAPLTLENTTVSGNIAQVGGGLFLYSYSDTPAWTLRHSTIVNNQAEGFGGGIVASFDTYGGGTTDITIENTVIANNSGGYPGSGDLYLSNVQGQVSYSLIENPGSGSVIVDNGGTITGVDPLLAPLADNGGPTATHAPQPGSPLIGAGDPTFTPPPANDQRGFARQVGVLDIGSVEVAATIAISTTSVSASEGGNASITVTLNREPGVTGPVSVDYQTVAGSATDGADYTGATGTLTWATGDSASKVITVPIATDAVPEGDETFQVVLGNPTGGAVVATDTATVTINGDAAGTVHFVTNALSVSESGGSLTVTVTRENGSTPITVDYATSNGTATAPGDYTTSSGTLSFAAGQTSQTFPIPITSDGTPEGTETFTVTLSNPTGGATIGSPSTLTVTISEGVLTFVVTNLNDSGEGSLRQALLNSNANPGTDTVTFESGLTGTIRLTTGEIDVTDSVIVDGPGSGVITVSGNDAGRILDIDVTDPGPFDGGEVSIDGLTFTEGRTASVGGAVRSNNEALTLADVVMTGNFAVGPGGALSATSGQLDISGSTFTDNRSMSNGGAVDGGLYYYSYYYSPGALEPIQVTITTSTFTGNSAPRGGAIAVASNPDSNLTIESSVISGNTANSGGGLYSGARTSIGAGTTIADNEARRGGGITIDGAALTIADSTISGNSAVFDGGGMSLYDGALQITSSTISGNTAGRRGGGIYLYLYGNGADTPINIEHSTIVDNSATGLYAAGGGIAVGAYLYNGPYAPAATPVPLNLDHTIVANNSSAGAGDDLYVTSGVDITANFSLIESTAGLSIAGSANQFGVDPLLGPLTDNGGPTLTHAPQDGSTAIDAGDPAFTPPPSTDQRGSARVFGTAIDIGAVEAGPQIEFAVTSIAVNELSGLATLTLNIIGSPTAPVTVDINTVPGTASPGSDYTSVSTTVTWNAGDTAAKTVTVPILDDSVIEGAEGFSVTLSNPTGGAVLGGATVANVTIADVEQGRLQFSPATYNVTENGGSILLTVTRVNGTDGTVGATYTTSNGSATGGSDYTASTGTVTFAAGSATSQSFSIPILDDTFVEGNETFTVSLSAPSGGATLGTPSTATVTIADHEPGTISLDAATYTVNEGGTVSITISRTGGADGAVSATYSTSNGSATAGSDYAAASGTVSFADGDTTPQTIAIPTTADGTNEGNETFAFALSAPTGGATLGTSAATVTIADPVGELNFSAPAYTVDEDGVSVAVVVTRSGGANGAVSVNYSTASGTATAGADFTTTSGTLTFADGDVTPQTINIPITDDMLAEGTEDFAIALSGPTGGATLGTQSSATITINDVEPGVLQFSAPSYSVDENGASISVTVTRSGGSDHDVTVDYATSNGSATSGSDYGATSGTLTFAAGDATSQTIVIPISDDTAVEGNETFSIALSNPTGGATLGAQSSATITINDVEPGVLQFSAPTYTAGETGGSVSITVTRSGGSTGAVTAAYSTSDGTATAGSDYTAASGTVSFAAGDATPQTIVIPIANDGVVEPDETFNIALSAPTGGAELGANSSAVVTITDVSPGELQFSAPAYNVDENGASLVVTVTRANGSTGAVSVDYATANGSATAGSDYGAVSGTVSFTNGDAAPKTISIPITDDSLVEGSETFTISLANPTGGATLGGISSATVTINDVEPGTLQFSAPTYSVDENGVSLVVTVTRANGSTGAVTADYATSNGGATAGSDYGATSGTVSFAAGDAAPKTITIPITDDTLVEGSETFTIALSNPTGGATLGAQSSATITINDVEPGVLQFSAPTYTAGETGGNVSITVTRSGGTTGAVSATYSTTNGTASAGSDYTAASGTVSFAAGDATPQTIVIPIANDGVVEPDETFNIALSAPTGGATLGANSSAVVTITDVSPGEVQFSAPMYTVSENGTSLVVTVTRANGSSGAVSVNYATTNGSATAGSDYAATSGTVSFAAGDAAPKTITIPITDDTVVEGTETFSIALSNPTGGATLGAQSSATITINDVEPGVLQFSAPTYTAGETGGSVSITVTRSGGTTGAVAASYATSNGTAAAGSDYTAAGGTVSFADGDATPQTIVIPIANDGVVEPDETFNIALSAPTGGATLGANSSAVVTITDVSPGELQFSAPTYTVSENGTSLVVTVTRANGSTGAVSVDYATANGSATAGSDYGAASGTVSFADGDTAAKTITIPITDDAVVEGSETFSIALTNPTGGATLGGINSAIVTIVDVEAGTLQFGAPTYNVTEDGGSLTVTVTRANGTTGAVSVDYATANGSATAGSDYASTSGTVTFADGDAAAKTITIPITDDTVVEGTETFSIALSNPTGGATLGAPNSATAAITDVEHGVLQFSAPTYTAGETGGSATVTVTRTGGSDGAVSASYSTSSGTAAAGSDYTASSGTVSFAAGDATPKTIVIPVANDGVAEPDETFNIALSSPTGGATLGADSSAVVTITDVSAGTLEFENATYTASENGATASITVTRTNGSDGVVSVQYATGGGTATAGSDYTSATGTLTFADGDAAPKTFTITLLDDTAPEGTETVGLTISAPTGGATLGAQDTATLSIVDDDADITRFTVTNITVNEGGIVTLTIQRNGFGPATIDYSTFDGTATGGGDFNTASGTLTFPSGSSTQTIQVQVNNDTLVEGPETFTVVLSNPVGTTIVDGTATVTINDAAAAAADIPTTGEIGRLLMTIGLGLAGLFAARRGRLFGFFLALLMAVALTTPPAEAQAAPSSGATMHRGVRAQKSGRQDAPRRIRGTIASVQFVDKDVTITLENGRKFTAPANKIKVRDTRAKGKDLHKKLDATALAAGQQVTILRFLNGSEKKSIERLRIRILE